MIITGENDKRHSQVGKRINDAKDNPGKEGVALTRLTEVLRWISSIYNNWLCIWFAGH